MSGAFSSPTDHTSKSFAEWASLKGRLLVAMPGIDDPRFEHAVILLCAHDADHAMGLRLDMPAPGIDLAEVLENLNIAPHGAAGKSVLVGGPVEQERGLVLHTDDWLSDGASLTVQGGMAVTGTQEALAAMSEITGPARSVLVLGYAGWDEGQLEEELSSNVWLLVDADHDLIFDDNYATKWSRALALMGVDAARLSTTGGHA